MQVLKQFDTMIFECIVNKPILSISDYGDVCFYGCNRDEPYAEDCKLYIVKSGGTTYQRTFAGVPVRGSFKMQSSYIQDTPKNVNGFVNLMLFLHPNRFGIEEVFILKTDLQGREIWTWKTAGSPVKSLITTTGEQYVFYFSQKEEARFIRSGVLVYLSQDGKVLWSRKDTWLRQASSFFILPDNLLAIFTCTTDPNLLGLISELYIVDTSGQIIKSISIINIAKEHEIHCSDMWQSPACNPQNNLIFMPESVGLFDISRSVFRYEPQPVILYNPVSGALHRKEFQVAEVKAFLWDDENHVLYTSSERDGDDIARINFTNEKVDYHSFPKKMA